MLPPKQNVPSPQHLPPQDVQIGARMPHGLVGHHAHRRRRGQLGVEDLGQRGRQPGQVIAAGQVVEPEHRNRRPRHRARRRRVVRRHGGPGDQRAAQREADPARRRAAAGELALHAGQRREQLAGVVEPVRAIDRDRLREQAADRPRDPRAGDPRAVRPRSGDGFPQRHPHRVDVGAGVRRVAAEQLGRHVQRRPGPHRVGRRGRCPDLGVQLRQAEIEHLGLAAGAQEHVAGLDVAMDHARRVGLDQRARHVRRDRHRVARRQLPVAGEPAAQRLALEQLEDQVRRALELAVIVQRDDVGVLQPRRRGGLGVKQRLAHRGVPPARPAHHLHGHQPTELRVARAVHHAELAAALHGDDLEPTDPLAHRGLGPRGLVQHAEHGRFDLAAQLPRRAVRRLARGSRRIVRRVGEPLAAALAARAVGLDPCPLRLCQRAVQELDDLVLAGTIVELDHTAHRPFGRR
ncbi:MAG TPA: hypothetical protein VHW23_12965 [Kofleriaceae bacterium]|nr:hypothetical protein [Kofleriaceae bacterium]